MDDLIAQRIFTHGNRIKGKLQGRNKLIYLIGDRVRLQNVKTKDFLLKGTVVDLRETDDQKVLSYNILTDCGYETTRHRRFLRPLHTDEETPEECSNVTGMILQILKK